MALDLPRAAYASGQVQTPNRPSAAARGVQLEGARPGGPAAINFNLNLNVKFKFEQAQWQAGMPVPRGTPVWRRRKHEAERGRYTQAAST